MDDLIASFSSLKRYVNLTTHDLQQDPNMREYLCLKLVEYLHVVIVLTAIIQSKAVHEELKNLLDRLELKLPELLNELRSTEAEQHTQHNNFRLN